MLDGLFLASTVSAVRAALTSAGLGEHGAGSVVVVGDVKLGKALRQEGLPAIVVAAKPPRGMPDALTGAIDKLPLEAGAAAAVVGVGALGHATALPEWCRVVRDGGAVVMVDRGAAADATRAALCAGLTEIEQRAAGRVTITSGLVTALAG